MCGLMHTLTREAAVSYMRLDAASVLLLIHVWCAVNRELSKAGRGQTELFKSGSV